jgi:antitoxin component YwqK of YwqJK toxin-antitoxin module
MSLKIKGILRQKRDKLMILVRVIILICILIGSAINSVAQDTTWHSSGYTVQDTVKLTPCIVTVYWHYDQNYKLKNALWLSSVGDTLSYGSYDHDGLPDGLWKSWYCSLQLRECVSYDAGTIDGVFQTWYEDGSIEYDSFLRKGLGTMTRYFRNGQMKSVETVGSDGSIVGRCVYYYSNGQLRYETDHSMPSFLLEEYYGNGILKAKGIVMYGVNRIGDWCFYDENGNKSSEGAYFSNIDKCWYSQKVGLWLTYDLNGDVTEKKFPDVRGSNCGSVGN